MRLCFGHKYKLADGMTALAQLYVLYSDKARSFNQWQRVLYSNFYDTIRENYMHILITILHKMTCWALIVQYLPQNLST